MERSSVFKRLGLFYCTCCPTCGCEANSPALHSPRAMGCAFSIMRLFRICGVRHERASWDSTCARLTKAANVEHQRGHNKTWSGRKNPHVDESPFRRQKIRTQKSIGLALKAAPRRFKCQPSFSSPIQVPQVRRFACHLLCLPNSHTGKKSRKKFLNTE